MGSNIAINKEIEKYINRYSLELNKVQKDIISYNDSLGDIKRKRDLLKSINYLHMKPIY